MEITLRSLWTIIHGMGFGALYLLACSGAFVELYRFATRTEPTQSAGSQTFLRVYLVAMVLLAWLTVFSGAYIIYPWYRAVAPPGTADLSAYPQLLLKSHPNTIGWHSLGMEWKEHVAWLTPISITMVAAVFFQYGRQLREHPSSAQRGALVYGSLLWRRRHRRRVRRHDQQVRPHAGRQNHHAVERSLAMNADTTHDQTLPNGPGAAAVLAAGIGCFFLGIFTLLGDKLPALKPHFTFYKPTGPLLRRHNARHHALAAELATLRRTVEDQNRSALSRCRHLLRLARDKSSPDFSTCHRSLLKARKPTQTSGLSCFRKTLSS